MDLLKLLLDSGKALNTCFLCFKHDENNLDIYTMYEISHEYNDNISLSLADILKKIFPFEDFDDILFGRSCNDCFELITKLYILIHKRRTKTTLLESIVKQIARKCNEFFISPENNCKISVEIQLPTFLQTKNDKRLAVNQEYESYNDTTLNAITKLVCEICDKTYESAESLEHHQLEHAEKEKTCPHCPATFSCIEQMSLHLKNHKKKRQRKPIYHYCNNCDYKTLSKNSLQAHVNKHHLQKRPHICQVCFKGFYKKSNLNEHLKTHNSHRDQVCEVCGWKFFHKKNLIEHLRLHSDSRPYECDICGKRFITSGRRTDHVKRNHMERSECCLICNKKYSLKKELTRHMNNVHLKNLC